MVLSVWWSLSAIIFCLSSSVYDFLNKGRKSRCMLFQGIRVLTIEVGLKEINSRLNTRAVHIDHEDMC